MVRTARMFERHGRIGDVTNVDLADIRERLDDVDERIRLNEEAAERLRAALRILGADRLDAEVGALNGALGRALVFLGDDEEAGPALDVSLRIAQALQLPAQPDCLRSRQALVQVDPQRNFRPDGFTHGAHPCHVLIERVPPNTHFHSAKSGLHETGCGALQRILGIVVPEADAAIDRNGGATRPQQVEENAKASEMTLTDDVIHRIDEILVDVVKYD